MLSDDELRALADALDPSGKVLTHPGDSALQRAADYLRAQADAQPVATLTLLDDMGAQIDFRQSFTLLPGQTFSLYAHPAPQAEPKREALTDEQADKLIIKVFGPNADLGWHTELVRAVERAHGIGGSDAE